MLHEENIEKKIFERDTLRPFELLDRIKYTSSLIWVYQSMEIQLEEFKKKNPESPLIEETQNKIDALTKLYTWLVTNYHNAEMIQKMSYEWQRMALLLTKDNEELKTENIKLKKMLDAGL